MMSWNSSGSEFWKDMKMSPGGGCCGDLLYLGMFLICFEVFDVKLIKDIRKEFLILTDYDLKSEN